MTKRSRKILAGCVVCVVLMAGAMGIYLYATYPKVPRVDEGTPTAAINFIASDDFNRMFIWHRERYARAAMERLKEMEFKDLISMERVIAGLRKNLSPLPECEKIEGVFLQTFLDKFYAMNKTQRNVVLTGVVLEQEKGHQLLPSADRFRADFATFLASQPPRTQAQTGQFLLDVRRQRDVMGMKSPY